MAGAGLNGDPSAMCLDDLPHNRQSEAGSLGFCGLKQRTESACLLFLGKPATAIFKLNRHWVITLAAFPGGQGADYQGPAVWHRVD